MECFFFFYQLHNQLNKRFPNLSKGGGIKAVKASYSSGSDSFGWYGTILDIAKEKVFDRNIVNESSIQAVERSKIWDVFLYLSKKRSENDYKNNYE